VVTVVIGLIVVPAALLLNGGGKGDVLARVRIQVPKRVNKKERDLLEQLQKASG